jgi:hypothetical protein
VWNRWKLHFYVFKIRTVQLWIGFGYIFVQQGNLHHGTWIQHGLSIAIMIVYPVKKLVPATVKFPWRWSCRN